MNLSTLWKQVRCVSLAALVLGFVVAQAPAVTFQEVVSLGDSLFDDPMNVRSPLIPEHLSSRLGVPLTQLAVEGATSSSLIASGQHTTAAATFGVGDLAMLWIGGNDFIGAGLAITFGNYAFLNTLEANVDTILGTLAASGVEIVVFNLPDFARVPAVIEGAPAGSLPNFTFASAEWRTRLDALAATHGAVVVDVFATMNDVFANPSSYAVGGQTPVFPPAFGEVGTCSFCLFADPIHPSSLGQGFLTNTTIQTVNAAFDPAGTMPLALLSETELLALTGGAVDVTLTPPTLRDVRAYPNPFDTAVRVDWALPHAGAVRVDVFDVNGRRVAGRRAPLSNRWDWDGRDDAGRRVVAGVYFLRVSNEAGFVTRKVVRQSP